MKRCIFCVFVLTALIFSSCGQGYVENGSSNDSSNLSSNTSSEHSSPDNSDSFSSSASEEVVEPSDVMNAYNDFLQNHNGEGPEEIYKFAFYDVTGDGIAELHAISDHHSIYTYSGGEVVKLYTSGANFQNSDIVLLENKALFVSFFSLGTRYYTYTTFTDSVVSSIHFWYDVDESFFDDDCPSEKEFEYSVSHSFDEKSVSKAEWELLTKDILALKKANIEWQRK